MAAFVVIAAQRLGLAVALRLGFDLGKQVGDVLFDGLSASVAEFHVVRVGTALVAVAFDDQGGHLLFFHALDIGRQGVLRLAGQAGFIEVKAHGRQGALAFAIEAFAVGAFEALTAIGIGLAAAAFGHRTLGSAQAHTILALLAGSAISVAHAFIDALVGGALLARAAIQLGRTAIGLTPASALDAGNADIRAGSWAVGVDPALRALAVHAEFAFGFAGFIADAVGVRRATSHCARCDYGDKSGPHPG